MRALNRPLALIAGVAMLLSATAWAQANHEQTVLGPGLYMFQTRLDEGTCGFSSNSGSVTSYYAAIDGTPGRSEMRMSLLNSTFWPRWELTVGSSGLVEGNSDQAGVTGAQRGRNTFRVTRENGRFVGRGRRHFWANIDGRRQECNVQYDALLQRIDRLPN